MSGITKFGSITPKAVIHKSESHKLNQTFEVAAGESITRGTPVMINDDGKVLPYLGNGTYIGIASTDSDNGPYREPNSPIKEVTVMVSGFAIVYGLSNAVTKAGYVKPTTAATEVNDYTTYEDAASDDTRNFIALNKTAGAGELIKILVK